MAKWIYWHPDLVREGIVKQGQPPIKQEPVQVEPPKPVAARKETPKIPEVPENVSLAPVPGWHEKTCDSCGRVFWARLRTRKYCTEECYLDGLRRREHEKSMQKNQDKRKGRTCAICGLPLPDELSLAYKTCGSPECRQERERQVHKESNRRARERRKLQ